MRKKVFGFFTVLSLFISSLSYAGGGMTHMYLAQAAIAQIPDRTLQNILIDHLDAYLVGAYYPDSGYVAGGYGEISHWDPFIYAFAGYIKETYSDPAIQNPKLVAFLFGCATHRVSDSILHFTFYPIVAKKDFKGDGKAAHTYGDIGIDLLLNVDKDQWLTHPLIWWVPVRDLLAVYHKNGQVI